MSFYTTLSALYFAWWLLNIWVCLRIPQKLIIKFTRHFFIRKDTKHSCYIFCSFQTGFYWANVHASCLLSTFQTFFTWRCMWWVVRWEKSCISYPHISLLITLLNSCLFKYLIVNNTVKKFDEFVDSSCSVLKILVIFFTSYI